MRCPYDGILMTEVLSNRIPTGMSYTFRCRSCNYYTTISENKPSQRPHIPPRETRG